MPKWKMLPTFRAGHQLCRPGVGIGSQNLGSDSKNLDVLREFLKKDAVPATRIIDP